MLVSNANRTGLDRSAIRVGRSFIYSKKDKGPTTET
jgi:hypothetical protein